MCKGNIATAAVLLLIGNIGVAADRVKEQKRCDSLEQEIGRIHSRMRQPYGARQGEKYKERLRDLRLEWAKRCR